MSKNSKTLILKFIFKINNKMKETDEEILSFLSRQRELVTTADVARGIRKPWATVQLHLLTLLANGLVSHSIIGRSHVWRISEEGKRAIGR